MNSNFNLPPGCTSRDTEGQPMPKCVECGEEFNPLEDGADETVCGDCKKLSPCCGVEFDEDFRICLKCGEHV